MRGSELSGAGSIQIGPFHIQQKPGENAQDLADEIIEKIKRELEAMKRRSYRDD